MSSSDVNRALVDGGEKRRELTGLEGSTLLLDEGGGLVGSSSPSVGGGGEVTSDVCKGWDAVIII